MVRRQQEKGKAAVESRVQWNGSTGKASRGALADPNIVRPSPFLPSHCCLYTSVPLAPHALPRTHIPVLPPCSASGITHNASSGCVRRTKIALISSSSLAFFAASRLLLFSSAFAVFRSVFSRPRPGAFLPLDFCLPMATAAEARVWLPRRHSAPARRPSTVLALLMSSSHWLSRGQAHSRTVLSQEVQPATSSRAVRHSCASQCSACATISGMSCLAANCRRPYTECQFQFNGCPRVETITVCPQPVSYTACRR